MRKTGQAFSDFKVFGLFLACCAVIVFLCGCADEINNPLAVEKLNGSPPKQELSGSELDARGIVNGVYFPEGTSAEGSSYPVKYTGNWRFVLQPKSSWYMVTSAEQGARIDFVATMSRVVFRFWDYEMYDNPGVVRFELDGKPLGTFNLARKADDDMKYLYYQVSTQKNNVATVSMIIEKGRATLASFFVVYLDPHFLY